VFIDAIVVKIRDGQVANRPIYAAIGVALAGEKERPARQEPTAD
jgi:putative transposase